MENASLSKYLKNSLFFLGCTFVMKSSHAKITILFCHQIISPGQILSRLLQADPKVVSGLGFRCYGGGGRGRGLGTILKWGGGGQTSPGVQGNPYPKLKNFPNFPPLFFGRDPSSRAKTNTNKNERHRRSKVGGTAPSGPEVGEASAPAPGSSDFTSSYIFFLCVSEQSSKTKVPDISFYYRKCGNIR